MAFTRGAASRINVSERPANQVDLVLRMREARILSGLSTAEVASLIGTSNQHIKMLELAYQRPTGPGIRKRLSELFDIPQEVLFFDVDRAYAYLRRIAEHDRIPEFFQAKVRQDLWKEPHERMVPDDD